MLRWLQKQDDDEDKSWTAAGREFQAAGPQTVGLNATNKYAAVYINTNSVRVRFALVRVVSGQAMFLGNPYECHLFMQQIVNIWRNFDANSYVHYRR